MLRVLASCDVAVVAANAITGDVGMVVRGRQPGNRRVAVIAVIAARDVRWMLAGRRHAIVA